MTYIVLGDGLYATAVCEALRLLLGEDCYPDLIVADRIPHGLPGPEPGEFFRAVLVVTPGSGRQMLAATRDLRESYEWLRLCYVVPDQATAHWIASVDLGPAVGRISELQAHAIVVRPSLSELVREADGDVARVDRRPDPILEALNGLRSAGGSLDVTAAEYCLERVRSVATRPLLLDAIYFRDHRSDLREQLEAVAAWTPETLVGDRERITALVDALGRMNACRTSAKPLPRSIQLFSSDILKTEKPTRR